MLSSKLNIILKYGLYLIILLPLAFTPFTFFPWHFGRTMIFQIIVEVLVFVYLWHILSFPRKRGSSQSTTAPNMLDSRFRGNDSRWAVFWRMLGRFNLLDWSVIFFLLILIITSLIGVNPVNSFWGNQARANGVFTWLHFGAFYFLLKYYLQNLGRRSSAVPIQSVIPAKAGIQQTPLRRLDSLFQWNDKWIIVISIVAAVLVSLTSIFPQILPSSWQATSGGGIIGNRAFLANYLILAIGLGLFSFTLCKNQWRWLFVAAVGLIVYILFLTGVRGAFLGLLTGLFVGLFVTTFVVQSKKFKIIFFSILVICVAGFLLFFVLYQNNKLSGMPRLNNLFNFSYTSGTGETRLMAWESAWQGVKEKPFFGWGWGNYEIIFDKYYNPQFLKHSFAETVWDKPHNWLLEIGVTAGIFGVIGYLAILFFAGFYLLRNCWPLDSRSPMPLEDKLRGNDSCGIVRTGRIILFATLLAYFVANLFLFETTNALILWFAILAFISVHNYYPRGSGDPVGGKTAYSLDSPIKSGNDKMRWFSVLFAILLIFYFIFLNFRFLKSSYYMRQAELSNVLMEWAGFANKALAVNVPFLPENAVFLAEQFTKFDKAGMIVKDKRVENTMLEIIGVLEKASSKYPDNLSFPVWAGQVYLVLGEKMDEKYYQKAEENLLKAEKISPRKQEVLFLLVRLYLLKQDFAQAIEFAQKAVDVAPDINTSHWFLGLANVASGHRQQGLKSIEKAIELGYSLTADRKLYVLDLYALEKDYPKLVEEYKKMIEVDPENINWLIKLASVYAESGDKKAALETTRWAVGLFPPLKTEAEKFIKQYKLLEK